MQKNEIKILSYWRDFKKEDYPSLLLFCFPIIFFCLQILIVPSQWNFISTNLIQLIWFSYSSLIMFILTFLEPKGYKLGQKFKCYPWVTFFLYEFVGVLSVVAYADVLIRVWFNQEVRPHVIFKDHLHLLAYAMSWLLYFFCWARVVCNHINVAKGQITMTNYYPRNLYMVINIGVIFLLTLKFGFSLTTGNIGKWDEKFQDSFESFFVMYISFICLLKEWDLHLKSMIHGIIVIISTMMSFEIVMITRYPEKSMYPTEIYQAHVIFYWMCCISAGRQMFVFKQHVYMYYEGRSEESDSEISEDSNSEISEDSGCFTR